MTTKGYIAVVSTEEQVLLMSLIAKYSIKYLNFSLGIYK